MADTTRVTGPLLDVLEVLLEAFRQGTAVHGWAIIKAAGRSGPTVYGVLERLEEREWIAGEWEDSAEPNRPRRRTYRLTPTGRIEAVALLAERRPDTSGTGRLGFAGGTA